MRKGNIFVSHTLSTLSVVLVLVVWQLYSIKVNNPYLMPEPTDVFKQLFQLLGDVDTYIVLLSTFKRLIFTIIIATVSGLLLGLFSGMHYQLEAFFKPIVISLRTLPVISIIIIVLILYGNTVSLYVISFLLLFPIIYQAELDGIKNIDPLLLDVLKLECSKCSFGAIWMVFVPLSLPHFRTGVLQSAGLGIKVLVVAEYMAQTKLSIGRELYMGRINLEYPKVFAWTIILIIIVVIIEHFVTRYLRYTTK